MSTRDDLELVREGLLTAFGKAKPEVMAQIAGQLRAVVKDLAALGDTDEGVSQADDIAARREARIARADDSASSSRRGQPRRRGGSNRAG